MRQKLNIWIAEQNLKNAFCLKQFLEKQEGIHIDHIFSKGKDLYEFLELECPDVLILDTDLEDMAGFAFLHRIERERGSIPFSFIIVSSVSHSELIRQAVNFGASYYMLKPYNQESIYHRILKCGSFMRNLLFFEGEEETEETDYQKLEEQVTYVIRDLGIPAHIKGYYYVRESIIMAVQDRNILNYITKMLYPAIAKKYRTTSSSVERAIRHAIEVAFSRGQAEYLDEMFGYMENAGKVKPTNSEFIALIADKMRLEYISCS